MDTQVVDILKIIVAGLFAAVITPLMTQVVIPLCKRRFRVYDTISNGAAGMETTTAEQQDNTQQPTTTSEHKSMKPVSEPEKQESTSKETVKVLGVELRKLSLLRWAVIGLIIGGLLAYFLIKPTFLSPCPLFASTGVTITSPASESKVPRFITVQGTACHIPNGEQLWVLIAVDGVTGYFPQPGPVSVGYDGKWFSRVTLGIDADRGKNFEINAVLVDKDGKTAIDRYFMQTPNPNYIGINSLQGITIMGTVNVIRT